MYNYSDEDLAKMALQEDPLVMYLILRDDLNMSVGKIGVQIGHAVEMIIFDCFLNMNTISSESSILFPWKKEGSRKILKGANKKEFEKLKSELEGLFIIKDAGLTEVECGTETAAVMYPIKKSETPKLIKKLQNLK